MHRPTMHPGKTPRALLAALLTLLLPAASIAGKKPEPEPAARYPLARLGARGVPTLFSLMSGHTDMTLDFTDDHHVLLTFGVRKLLARDEQGEKHADHTLQAEIINTDSGDVEKSQTFTLHDLEPYLWPLGDGQFLLRQGNQFSILGPQLEPRRVFYTEGAVRWVQTAPAAGFAAIIVEHEQHTPEDHQRMHSQAMLHGLPEPAEREEAFGFRIGPELTQVFHADVPEPGYISGSSEWFARPDLIRPDKYRISLKDWPTTDPQPTGQAYTEVATVHSTCTPTAQVLAEDRLLIHTCDGDEKKQAAIALTTTGGKQTGRQLWTGRAPSTPRATTESAAGGHFILEQSVTPWRSEDQTLPGKGALTVLDAATGAELITIHLQPLYGFTRIADISPDGTTLAVLTNSELQLFKLPHTTK